MGAEDNDRWRQALDAAAQRQREQSQQEYSQTAWVSFRWIFQIAKRIFKRK